MVSTLLTPEEAARFLGVKEDTLYRWRHRGSGPAYVRVGRFVRYHKDDLNAWLAEQRVTTGGDKQWMF